MTTYHAPEYSGRPHCEQHEIPLGGDDDAICPLCLAREVIESGDVVDAFVAFAAEQVSGDDDELADDLILTLEDATHEAFTLFGRYLARKAGEVPAQPDLGPKVRPMSHAPLCGETYAMRDRTLRCERPAGHPKPCIMPDVPLDLVGEALRIVRGIGTDKPTAGHIDALFEIIKQRDETIRGLLYPVREG